MIHVATRNRTMALEVARATSGSEPLQHDLRAYVVEHGRGELLLRVQVDFPTTGYPLSKTRNAAIALDIPPWSDVVNSTR